MSSEWDDEDDAISEWVDEETLERQRLSAPPEGDLVTANPDEVVGAELLEALGDPTMPRRYPQQPRETTPQKFHAGIMALRGLHPHQRVAVAALVQTGFRIGEAAKIVAQRTQSRCGRSTVSRWSFDPDFIKAVETVRDHVLGLANINPAGVMLRASELYEKALTPQPILHKGRHTGFTEVNLGVAAKVNGDMAKWVGLDQTDTGTRMTVQVINMSKRETA